MRRHESEFDVSSADSIFLIACFGHARGTRNAHSADIRDRTDRTGCRTSFDKFSDVVCPLSLADAGVAQSLVPSIWYSGTAERLDNGGSSALVFTLLLSAWSTE